ncbi:transposase [Plantibacter sp. RU18]|uniref:transposase n=1 Tax=Plantibacter sp. RU18 TaxID=3158143 RepID=UPI003D365D95
MAFLWARIAATAKGGRLFQHHRGATEGIIYRCRTGIAWRDMPARFGSWKTAWKRHRRFRGDGTWDKILTEPLAQSDAAGLI